MQFSVIIPTYNKRARLKLMLQSLMLQTIDPDQFELIFINDGSTDDTADFLDTWIGCVNRKAKQIITRRNGRAASRNAGVKASQGRYLVFSDDDLIWAPSYLQAFAERIVISDNNTVIHGHIFNLPFVRFLDDPSDALSVQRKAGHQERDSNGFSSVVITEADIRERFTEKIQSQGRVTHFEKGVRFALSEQAGPTPWVGFTGGNVCVHRALIEKVTGFDEGFGTMWGAEDLELGYRLYREGVQFCMLPDAASYHLAHIHHNRDAEHDASLRYFYDKHQDPLIWELRHFLNDRETMSDFYKRMHWVSPSLW